MTTWLHITARYGHALKQLQDFPTKGFATWLSALALTPPKGLIPEALNEAVFTDSNQTQNFCETFKSHN